MGCAESVAAMEGYRHAKERRRRAERALEKRQEVVGEHARLRDEWDGGGRGACSSIGRACRGAVDRCRWVGVMGWGSYMGLGRRAIWWAECGRWSGAWAMGGLCHRRLTLLCAIPAPRCCLMPLLLPILSRPPPLLGRSPALWAAAGPAVSGVAGRHTAWVSRLCRVCHEHVEGDMGAEYEEGEEVTLGSEGEDYKSP